MNQTPILHQFQRRNTYEHRPDDRHLQLAFECVKDEEQRYNGMSIQDRYELTLTIKAEYWANTVQEPFARRNAEAYIQKALFHAVEAELQEIRMATMMRDEGKVLAACQRLQELISV